MRAKIGRGFFLLLSSSKPQQVAASCSKMQQASRLSCSLQRALDAQVPRRAGGGEGRLHHQGGTHEVHLGKRLFRKRNERLRIRLPSRLQVPLPRWAAGDSYKAFFAKYQQLLPPAARRQTPSQPARLSGASSGLVSSLWRPRWVSLQSWRSCLTCRRRSATSTA